MQLSDYQAPHSLVAGVLERGLRPPPPVDLRGWAVRNLRFGSESQFQGPFDASRFPFWDRLFEVLSPDDPARVVTLRGSAQIGKTVVANIFLGATQDLDPCPFMYVHPTEPNARDWVKAKWWPMIRRTPALFKIFEDRSSGRGITSLESQERLDGRGIILFSGANSAASLSMRSVRRQVQDDLSKWGDLSEGDPEGLADDRSKAFPWGKIFKISTPAEKDACRITADFLQGSQEFFHVPCPHCSHRHPLDWNEFRARVEVNVADCFFVCPSCGGVIEEKHRAQMVAAGEWVAHNTNPRPGWVSFHLWAAYAGLESWAEIARTWCEAKDDPDKEKRVTNSTGGEPYEQPGQAPDWERLKARAEPGPDGLRPDGQPARLRGVVPIGALLLTLTLDCQDDYVDGVVVGWGRDLRRWVVERVRVEGHISTPETRAELNALIAKAWPTAVNSRRQADQVGIDANAWTDDVFDWARQHPKHRVIMVRGVPGENQPSLGLVRKERRRDGKVVKYQGRFFNVGVDGIKGSLYRFLANDNPDGRGYVDFPAGLDDDYYEQLTAEKRVAVIDKRGFAKHQWQKPRSARNEQLDVMVYAQALAGRAGWRTLTPAQWAALEAEREVAVERQAQPQLGLFTDALPATSANPLTNVSNDPSPAASPTPAMALPSRGRSILSGL